MEHQTLISLSSGCCLNNKNYTRYIYESYTTYMLTFTRTSSPMRKICCKVSHCKDRTCTYMFEQMHAQTHTRTHSNMCQQVWIFIQNIEQKHEIIKPTYTKHKKIIKKNYHVTVKSYKNIQLVP